MSAKIALQHMPACMDHLAQSLQTGTVRLLRTLRGGTVGSMRTWGVALVALAATGCAAEAGGSAAPIPIGCVGGVCDVPVGPAAPVMEGIAGAGAPAMTDPTVGQAVTPEMQPLPPPDMATSETPVTFPNNLPPPPDPSMTPPMDPLPPVPPGAQVPDGAHCAPVATWDPTSTQYEEEVLRLTNEARAVGHNCDTEGNFGPAPPLTMEAHLRCSSRLHSMDMAMQGYFDHTNKMGQSPFDRMQAAGYAGSAMGENIAMGQRSPAEVVAGWLDSDGHCSNIMNPMFTQIGVGYYAGAGGSFWQQSLLWTQNFGRPGW